MERYSYAFGSLSSPSSLHPTSPNKEEIPPEAAKCPQSEHNLLASEVSGSFAEGEELEISKQMLPQEGRKI